MIPHGEAASTMT